MSLLASETQTKVSGCREALHAVEEHLMPLLAKDPKEVQRKLAPLETAELKVALAYSVASMYFSNLLTQGIDPSTHPIQQELGRIQKYFKKVRTTKEEVVVQQEAKNRKRVDVEAVKRIVQHFALASEAHSARREHGPGASSGSVLAPRSQGGDAWAKVAAGAAKAAHRAQQAAPEAARVLAEFTAQEPVDLTEQPEAAPSEPAATVSKPLKKKRRKGVAASWTGVPPVEGAVAAVAAWAAEPQLCLAPVMPSAGAEEHATAAALVAEGQAAAAEGGARKRKKKRKVAGGGGPATM